MVISARDKEILRDKAKKVLEYAESPENQKKILKWTGHNDLKDPYPVLFCDAETAWQEIRAEYEFRCEGEDARSFEWGLEYNLIYAEKIKDDRVISPVYTCCYFADPGNWGVGQVKVGGETSAQAYTWIPPLQDLDRDFEKLKYPEPAINETMSRNFFETAKDLFDGILRVELYHPWWWSLGLTMQYIYLRGLENFMLDLYDNPDGVHRLMAFLRDGTLHFLDKLEQKGWLTSNIGNYYVGSGGFGFTDAIKHKTKDVKCSDMWGFCESQETSSVSPEMFSEFVLPYQIPILDRFALNCYGCCEPLDGKWKYIRNIKNLRRVSVSRWADKAKMSEALGKDYIYSYKPNPSYLALKNIEEEEVRKELRSVLQLAKQNGNRLELIMKDTTTLGGSGKNLYRFSQIAKEEIEKIF